MTEENMGKYPESVTERTCANCREWEYNSLGERECLQTSCEDYSDWVERPKKSKVEKMTEIWFFLIRTNTDHVMESKYFKTFEEAYDAMCKWDNPYERIITPVMKGYVKE